MATGLNAPPFILVISTIFFSSFSSRKIKNNSAIRVFLRKNFGVLAVSFYDICELNSQKWDILIRCGGKEHFANT